MNETDKIFLVEDEYIGPNRASKGQRAHLIRVLDTPARTNMSGEARITGWLGTTDDWYREALGEFSRTEAIEELAKRGIVATERRIVHGEEFFLMD